MTSSLSRIQSAGHVAAVNKSLNHHFECDNFCDITLITQTPGAGGEFLKCHKVMLSSSCYYFREKIRRDPTICCIDLSPMRIEVLKEMLTFIYSGKCAMSEGSVFEILTANKDWQVALFKEKCHDFLDCMIDITSVCGYYEQALRIKDVKLIKKFSFYIRKYFIDIYHYDKFRNLSLDSYYDIIKHDEIDVANEDLVFRGLVDFNQREPNIEFNFTSIRFENISEDYFFEEVVCHYLIVDAIDKNQVSIACDHKVKNNSIMINPRSWKLENTSHIVCLDKLNLLLLFNQQSKTWNHIKRSPNWITSFASMVVHKERCIYIGNNEINGPKNIICELKLNPPYTLKYYDNFPGSIDDPIGVVNRRHLYIFGKSDTRHQMNSFRYSFDRGTWEPIRAFTNKDDAMVCVSRENNVYFLGGLKYKKYFFTYNTKKNLYKRLVDIPVGCSNKTDSAFAIQDKIYLMKDEGCYIYDIFENKWTKEGKEYTNLVDIRNIFVYEEQFCCLHVENGKGRFKKYDINSNTWSDIDIPPIEIGDVYWNYII